MAGRPHPPRPGPPPGGAGDTPGTGTPPAAPPSGGAGSAVPPVRDPVTEAGPGRAAVDLLPVREGVAARTAPRQDIAVPSASAFPALLPLQRALRPFRRYRLSAVPGPGEVDETATADRAADCGLVWPVLRPVHGREADLQLLVDSSPSMTVWEQMVHELREVCEWVGAFRSVTVRHLRPDGTGVAASALPHLNAPRVPAEQLLEPGGRRVTLVVSDCAGPLWQGSAMRELLHRGVRGGPLAVLQPLSQRLWARTRLPAEPGTLRRRPGGYGPLEFTPLRRTARDAGAPAALPVPVLAASPGALSTWARLVTGNTGVRLRGAAAWVGGPGTTGPGAGPARPGGSPARDAAQLLAAFEASASPLGRQLAVYLSAAPLSLPVMQLVQRAMLPQTGPAELSEVLLSGLVVQAPGPEGTEAPGAYRGEPWYEFLPGVRDLLIDRLSAGEAALVLKHCSLYVERAFGRSARNFPAVAVAYLMDVGTDPEIGPDAVPEPFARVSERVLRRFEPEPALLRHTSAAPGAGELGRTLLDRYERERSPRDLLAAARLLRAAADTGPSGELLARLADALRQTWQEWGGEDVLDEAERAARGALAADRTLSTGLALARVLDARARAALAAGRAAQAVAGLRETAGHCRTALEEAEGNGDEARLACVLLLAEALRTLSATAPGGPRPALLEEAQEALTAQARRWPAGRVPPPLLLSRGHVLLDLARLSGERGFALRAAADLASAVEGLREDPDARHDSLPTALTGLAEALSAPPDGQGGDEAHELLTEAAALAREAADPLAEAACLTLAARNRRDHHDRTGDLDALRAADEAFTRARRLVPPDTHRHVDLLTESGELALRRAESEPESTQLAARAVQLLREANGRTGSDDPRAGHRRLLFGRALRLRHEQQGGVADLHEAAWTLTLATRDDGGTGAQAWLELGDVQALLARRTGVFHHYAQASTAYLRAATGTGDALTAARARHRRGEVLEHTAGPARALESYRLARALWEELDATDTEEARRTMDRIARLEARP
ncbi:SAV_2336 N-terminal domain-related protein [Streptomyces sp. Tu 3180]|uniref:SAV_2336 N-terminal domain-related protein n=1 Tax=Streptomyces sp. Tu 3180 TaxID=2682611 RepID=UPI0024411D61|nr:SAV_2336 N-terminal domain-related protein [Streptomyces sp. Tu 3180]